MARSLGVAWRGWHGGSSADWRGVAAAGIAIVAIPQAMGAGVRTAPAASGSLERADRDCSTEPDPDLVTTYREYCILRRLGIPDDPNMYSVYWAQIAVEPRRGWCLANAHGFMRAPGSRVDAWIPKPPATAGLNSVRLSVTSRDRMLGTVKQRFRLSHGEHLERMSSVGRVGIGTPGIARPKPTQGAH